MTSTETRIKLRTLSTSTTDPDKAGELMLEAAKLTVKMTKRVLAYNLVKGLQRRRQRQRWAWTWRLKALVYAKILF